MTPNEIITEALYNIYGASTPDASVQTRASSVLKRLYDQVQRKVPWWFLERYFTSPAVNMNVSGYRPDGILDVPQEIISIGYRNGLVVLLVQETAAVMRIYTVDPKTLMTQKCGSFTKPVWQNSVELRYDHATDKLYLRLENDRFSGGSASHMSDIYEITEEGDIITTITPTKVMNQSWGAYGGIIYYVSQAYTVWDWSFQLRKINGPYDTQLNPLIAGLIDIAVSSEGIVGLTAEYAGYSASSVVWYGFDGIANNLTSGGTSRYDKLMAGEENIFIASRYGDSDQIRVRYFDPVSDNGSPSYTHKGSVSISPWREGATISTDFIDNSVFFCVGNYMFVAQRNSDGTASMLRLTSEKMGAIIEMHNSSRRRVERRKVGDVRVSVSGEPDFYTDEESASGKRDITLYPQSQYSTVSTRAIVYIDMGEEEDIVTQVLEDYLIKKLTAELSLISEYADRYQAYSVAAEEALAIARARGCDFSAQEYTPGYADV